MIRVVPRAGRWSDDQVRRIILWILVDVAKLLLNVVVEFFWLRSEDIYIMLTLVTKDINK
jgi:hypothetical protein